MLVVERHHSMSKAASPLNDNVIALKDHLSNKAGLDNPLRASINSYGAILNK